MAHFGILSRFLFRFALRLLLICFLAIRRLYSDFVLLASDDTWLTGKPRFRVPQTEHRIYGESIGPMNPGAESPLHSGRLFAFYA